MRLKGQISIVRQSGSGEDMSLVAIEVTDGLSGCRMRAQPRFFSCRMSLSLTMTSLRYLYNPSLPMTRTIAKTTTKMMTTRLVLGLTILWRSLPWILIMLYPLSLPRPFICNLWLS